MPQGLIHTAKCKSYFPFLALVHCGVNMDTLSKGSKAQRKSFLTFDF